MTKRLIVTGAGGFVAGSVIRQAMGSWDVHGLSGKTAPVQEAGLTWHVLDLLDGDRLRKTFDDIRPDAIVHAAAMANIDTAETERDLAHRINVELTRVLCELCAATGAKMVFCSTDTVFDGDKGNYVEADPPGAINYYAETKVEAERIVAALPENRVIARLALVMGFPVLGAGNSFLARTEPMLRKGRTLSIPAEEIRSPVDVITLGRALVELAGNDLDGIIHLAGNTVLNRVELTQQIAEALGYSKNLVTAKPPDKTPGRAPRPRDVSLKNTKARSELETPMLDLADALALICAANATS